MEIRKAVLKDKKGVGNVLAQSYNIKNIDEGANFFRDELVRKHNFIVAIENEKIIGTASWVMHGLFKHGLAELDRIAVLPEYRGKGVSDRLFEFLVKDIQKFYSSRGFKLRKLYLVTHDDNKRAQEFYKRIGFKYEARLKNHFYKDKDELVLSMFF
jgi:ribosomal protein S18 acetylase RimI-like enzyme